MHRVAGSNPGGAIFLDFFFFCNIFRSFLCEKSFVCKPTKYAEKMRKNVKKNEFSVNFEVRKVALSVIFRFVIVGVKWCRNSILNFELQKICL